MGESANAMMSLFTQTPREEAIDVLHSLTAIYTAEPVVDDLLNRIDWPRGKRRLIDPSCGDGVILGRALQRLIRAQPEIDIASLVDVLEGWEVHPYAAAEARGRIATILREHGWNNDGAKEAAERIVRNADFLTEGPEPGTAYSVCVTNPPYLRYANVPELLRREYQEVVPDHARADLLHSFLDRCAESLAPDGEAALVTADRWLFNSNARALRASLGKRLGIDHLKRLDPSSVFYRPKLRRAGTPPRIHPVAVVLRAPSQTTRRLSEEAIYPDAVADNSTGRTLNDVATVRLSPWLGTPGIFVVNSEIASRLPQAWLVPAVDTDDVTKDGKLLTPKRYAIRTTPEIEPPAEIMAHLDAELHRMAPRGRQTPRWIPPESWRSLDLSRPSLLVPRIAKTLRPIHVPAGILPINHNLSIVSQGEFTLAQIEGVLTSERARAWVQAYAPRLENGYFSITTTLLRKLPVDVAL